MIFPGREKYAQSRKLPFLAFQDRFRRFISSGECLVIVLGYSFSDEHLNEIFFQGLRSNPRLAIAVLVHSGPPDRLLQYGQEHRNLSFYGPDKACVGGIVAPWREPGKKPEQKDNWPFWDETDKRFTLGDFNSFASFLEEFIGFRRSLDSAHGDSPPLGASQGSGQEGTQP